MRFYKGVSLAVGIVAVWLGASGARGDDWNQWRGANRSGKVSGFAIPKAWPAALNKKWSVTVGEGHSSPIIVGEKAFVLVRKGDNEIVYCLSMKDGGTIWQDTVSAPFDSVIFPARKLGKSPRSTPLISGGKLYTVGVGGMMTCYNANTGKLLWRKDFAPLFSVAMPICGASLSPLVDGKKIYIHAGQGAEGAFFALDKDTGKEIWKWTGEGPAYTSPQIAQIGGTRQIVTAANDSWIGLYPVDGKLLWRIPNRANMFNHNSITPIIVGDVMVTGANQRETIAYKLAKTGGKWEAKLLWNTRNVTMSTSSPILDGNRIYAVNEKRRGQIVAMALDSGQVFWACEGNKGENVTLYDVGADVLAFDEGGEMIVYTKTAKGLTQTAKYNVADSEVWASPAVSNNRILVKGAETLTLWEVK